MTAEPPPKSASRLRLLNNKFTAFIVAILLFILIGIGGVIVWLDTDDGHKFIIGQVEGLRPKDGLRIGITSIDGSIYGQPTVNGLTLRDPKGIFFSSEMVAVDWNPLAWIFNELHIRKAVIAKGRLERLPELIDTGEDKPLLPEFDVFIGSFSADNLSLGEAIAGEEQYADISGAADVRAGRAMVNLDAATTRSGDKLFLTLNAEPSREQLDLNADISAPAGGAIANYLDLKRSYTVRLAGDGNWAKWDGKLNMASETQSVAELDLSARAGKFGAAGTIAQTMLPEGIARKIGAPRLAITGNFTFRDSLANIDFQARSAAMAVNAAGGFDLRRNALEAMKISADVRDPSVLSSDFRAQALRGKMLFNGKLSELRYQYDLGAQQFAIGKTLLGGVRATGEGKRDRSGFDIPLELSVQSLIGNGELFKRLAAGFDGKANLRLENNLLTAQKAVFATETMSGTANINIPLSSGEYVIDIDATAPGFAVQGIGLADIAAQLKISPVVKKIGVAGKVTAQLRRFDNEFLRNLGGGLPVLDTDILLGADRKLRFANLNIKAPKISVQGGGVQTGATTYSFTGSGSHSDYGRFDVGLDGPLERPKIALLLKNPLDAAGLANVRLLLDPTDTGFSYTAAGGSTLGPFTSNGAIIAPRGGQALVRVDRLLVSRTTATGIIRPTSAGLAGTLDISGGGVNGSVLFDPLQNQQLIRAKLVAENAVFNGNPSITIRTGSLDADIRLISGKSNVTATMRGQGISRGNLFIGQIAGNAKLVNGAGSATFSIAGSRGSTFNFQAKADVTPNRYVVNGSGVYENRALKLSRALVLTHEGTSWNAAPTTLTYGTGQMRVSGRFGGGSSRLQMNLSNMPLSLADIADDNLGLGGFAFGTVDLTQSGDRMPVGSAKLTVRGLTRSGLLLTSRPVDVGLNIAFSPANAAARGVIRNQSGQTIGRFQGRVSGLGNGNWVSELRGRPLFAQARFNGAADNLWRLTGVETFDLTGPLAVSADIGGTLANPQIKGKLQTTNARLESGLMGTVISGIKASGTFDGSRLVLPNLSGTARGGGTVSGRGIFDFGVPPEIGVGIDVNVTATGAALIARDDFAATVTGPIHISNSAKGGVISGDVTLNRSFFKFGRASSGAALPVIKTTEINRRADERPTRVRRQSWRFALNARVPNRLQVEGLGLDSEWRADLALSGPVENFAINGEATLVQGNYTFAGRRFRLERGRIRFNGNQPPNPVLDIVAEANLTGFNATINVGGTGNKPEITFASVPALPQDELLSRVLFGSSIANLSAPEAVQLAAAVASLNSGGGLDPINQLRKAVGLDRLRILPSDNDLGQGTSIAAGKYITRRVYVELITDGKGYSATRLEFQISRWLSILSSISTLGRQSANIRVSKDY